MSYNKCEQLRFTKALNIDAVINEHVHVVKRESGCFFLADDNDDVKESIVEIFDIKNPHFDTKFKEAISGDGNEAGNLLNLRSSALLALLCFYNISQENPIKINGVTYTNSYFEVKNKVFNNPSNMDVVLTNEEGDILFIESKFTEYTEIEKHGIKKINKYFNDKHTGPIYREAFKVGILEEVEDGMIKANNSYTTGIKQIISHYLGIVNFVRRDKVNYLDNYVISNRIRNEIYKKEWKNVRFIEIMYDLTNVECYKKAMNNYLINVQKLIPILYDEFKKIDNISSKTNVEFELPTTYQSIFKENKNVLDTKIKEFYNL